MRINSLPIFSLFLRITAWNNTLWTVWSIGNSATYFNPLQSLFFLMFKLSHLQCCLLSLDMTPFIFNCFLVFWPQQKIPGSSCTFLALEPRMNHFFQEPGSFQCELEWKKRSEMQNIADHWLPRTQGLPFPSAPWVWKLSDNLWGHWRSLAPMTAATAHHR